MPQCRVVFLATLRFLAEPHPGASLTKGYAAESKIDCATNAKLIATQKGIPLDKLLIKGGKPLYGRIVTSGAKNAALPAMAAALLTAEEIVLKNVPAVRDIKTMGRLLAGLGCQADLCNLELAHQLRLQASKIHSTEAPYDLVKTMRASVLVLGPLVARFGHARVSLPGGCAIGARPVDLHIRGLEKLGARVKIEHGYVEATASRLKGGQITFERVTVTGTENLMMAACLAEGETHLQNAACEPEIVDLANLLRDMGARIAGDGTSQIRVEGVEKLSGFTHTVIPDRIEAGTFLIAGAIAGGEVEVDGCVPEHMEALTEKLTETGIKLERIKKNTLHVSAPDGILSRDIKTLEHPGFPTDMQAQYMTLMTQAAGRAMITETIFENRFMHALELNRMGADIKVEGNRAIVTGHTPLSGANVIASDLRASASLVLAGLMAEGETLIDRVYHLDRGYEKIEEKLRALGAEIIRVK